MQSFVVFSFIRSKLTLNTLVHILSLKRERIGASLMMKSEGTAKVENHQFLLDNAIEPPSFLPVLCRNQFSRQLFPAPVQQCCFNRDLHMKSAVIIKSGEPSRNKRRGEYRFQKRRSCRMSRTGPN